MAPPLVYGNGVTGNSVIFNKLLPPTIILIKQKNFKMLIITHHPNITIPQHPNKIEKYIFLKKGLVS